MAQAWKSVIGVGAFDLDRVLNFEPEFLTDLDAEHQHDASVSSVSVKFEGELMVRALERWIGELIQTKGADLFRYKGVMAVKGAAAKFIFQGVGMLFNGGFSDLEWGPRCRHSRPDARPDPGPGWRTRTTATCP